MKTAHSSALLVALAAAVIFGGTSAASVPRKGRPASGPWWTRPLAIEPRPLTHDPQCVPGEPCPTSGGTTAGTSSGTSAGTTGTTATTSTSGTSSSTTGTTNGTSTGSTATSTGTTTGTSTGTTGTTATTSTNGTTATTGSTGDSTGGTTGGTGEGDDWDASGSSTTVDGVADGGYISGTNVNASFTLRLKKTGGPYTSALVQSAEITVGGEIDSVFSPTIPTAGGANVIYPDASGVATYSIPVRFASTRFKDAKSVVLRAKFTYRLQDDQGNGLKPVA